MMNLLLIKLQSSHDDDLWWRCSLQVHVRRRLADHRQGRSQVSVQGCRREHPPWCCWCWCAVALRQAPGGHVRQGLLWRLWLSALCWTDLYIRLLVLSTILHVTRPSTIDSVVYFRFSSRLIDTNIKVSYTTEHTRACLERLGDEICCYLSPDA